MFVFVMSRLLSRAGELEERINHEYAVVTSGEELKSGTTAHNRWGLNWVNAFFSRNMVFLFFEVSGDSDQDGFLWRAGQHLAVRRRDLEPLPCPFQIVVAQVGHITIRLVKMPRRREISSACETDFSSR